MVASLFERVLKFRSVPARWTVAIGGGIAGTALVAIFLTSAYIGELRTEKTLLGEQFQKIYDELATLKNEDQYKKNQTLVNEIQNIEGTYNHAVHTYEILLDLKTQTKDTSKYDSQFADSLSLLADRKWASAAALLISLDQSLALAQQALAPPTAEAQNVPVSGGVPASGGYSRQWVSVNGVNFLVDVVAGDLSQTRVIVDTASDHDCANNCPTLPLGDYVSRNGAYAGVNGSYFCPSEYPSCAGKTNSFDTLLMNKNKVYFNSANNIYSTVPAVIFLGSSVRFVGQSLEWGRDTSPDSLIANRPMLIAGGNIVFTGAGEPKEGSAGNRGFVANKGNTVYVGVVHGVSVAQSAQVLHALGMDNAINLDDGGSTALWYGGYKVGPGRNLPNVILFVRK
ncbi:phosphodiester glycosidase family protein [Candidatus Gottesmanbacteria bacterium]|nr:phosphodiester glycosidase family protein [Candidatus Gottesmanbacteria bacterium]